MRFAAAAILAFASCLSALGAHAAEFFCKFPSVPQGTEFVDVAIWVIPSNLDERIGAMNISFSAGQPGDGIAIIETGTEWDGTLWAGDLDEEGADPAKRTQYFGAVRTYQRDVQRHRALVAVCMVGPARTRPVGKVVSFRLHTGSLPPGEYRLEPNAIIDTGTGEFLTGSAADTPTVSFSAGVLTITEREP